MNDQALIIFHYHIHDMCLWQIDVHACIFQGHNTILFNIIWNDYYSGINQVLTRKITMSLSISDPIRYISYNNVRF